MKKIGFSAAALLIFTAFIFCPTSVSAQNNERLLKEGSHTIYHVFKDKLLLDAAKQIAMRSGIDFKVNPKIKSDIVTKKLAADDWKTAVYQLLEGYNYSIVTSEGKIKSIIISGRNGSGTVAAQGNVSKNEWLSVKAGGIKLPSRYQGLAAGSVMPIKLPISKIKAVELGKKMLLELPIGQYSVKHDDKVDDGSGAMTWMGYLDDEGKGYRVYISQGDAGIMGNITTPDGSYEIETVDGSTYLIDLTRAGLTVGSFADDQAGAVPVFAKKTAIAPVKGQSNGIISSPTAMATATTTSTTTTALTTSTTTSTVPVVDVMVLYTTVNQTATYAKQRIQYLVNITNRAYQDSFINLRLRLVHTRPTNYIEKSRNSIALTDLAGGKLAFVNVPALRTQYGADVVLLMRPYYVSTSGSCGVAYVGFSSGSGANPGSAFGVISDGKSRDAPTNYYCGISSFAHEVGHTMGNVHDRVYTGFPGKFPYSYAWGINNKFGTVMSYYGPSLMLFATPKLATQCAGLPCGYAAGTVNASDQSRTINYTGPLVSNYKPKTMVTPDIQ